MEMETKKIGDVLIIKPVLKRIDSAASVEFGETFLSFCSADARTVILNLANVEFVDSRGIGTLISLFKKVEDRGSLLLCNMKSPVMSLFHLTRMDKVFTIFDTEEEALKHHAPKAHTSK